MDFFLVWNLPSFKCLPQIQYLYMTFNQTNQVYRLDLAMDHLFTNRGLEFDLSVFVCEVSVLCLPPCTL